MKIVILGLTITSSWGNGHATTFRALCRALHARGHRIDFLEKNEEWYASHRDLVAPSFCNVYLYDDWETEGSQLACRLAADSDVVVIGSYFPDAQQATRRLLNCIQAPITFYDIDTPITLAGLRKDGRTSYLDAELIPLYAAYLSFTGGPVLAEIETRFGSPMAVPLYCSVDPTLYTRTAPKAAYACDLSYLGTYAVDRQAKLLQLLGETAACLPNCNFLVGGPMYPAETPWHENTRWISHVAPADHPSFYSSARFTLNLTREEMVRTGYSPSVRLFEASACGATILSDSWPGLESFLTPGEEIILVDDTESVVRALRDLPDADRLRIGRRARDRVLASHTAEHRALEFEAIISRIDTAPASHVMSAQ